MNNDIALFLDLDNIVIGAAEVDIHFDINLILDHIKEITQGRVVLRRAYGDWRQNVRVPKELATAGFELQSTVRLGNTSKNLADMQMVVDAMETLIDGHTFTTYVVITGDRDFMPLVQTLRKRGKIVIGIGVRHASSNSLIHLCDQYTYYDDLVTQSDNLDTPALLNQALTELLRHTDRVPASVLKERMNKLSKGAFNRSATGRKGFRQLLNAHPQHVQTRQDGSTIFVMRPSANGSNGTAPSRYKLLTPSESAEILEKALDELLAESDTIRASRLKQQMQMLSDGQFDEQKLGDKNFTAFLRRHPNLLQIYSQESTMYIRRASESAPVITAENKAHTAVVTDEIDLAALIQQAASHLFTDQDHVRAGIFKEKMEQLSPGITAAKNLKEPSFGEFLASYPQLVTLVQRGDTLFVYKVDAKPEILLSQLPNQYRSKLKKRGLRVLPHQKRFMLLRDILSRLLKRPFLWKELVDQIAEKYTEGTHQISKSMIHDALRLAKRAKVIGLDNPNGMLASSPVKILLPRSDNLLKESIMRCDMVYLSTIQELPMLFAIEQASEALYEDQSHVTYLKFILKRYSEHIPA